MFFTLILCKLNSTSIKYQLNNLYYSKFKKKNNEKKEYVLKINGYSFILFTNKLPQIDTIKEKMVRKYILIECRLLLSVRLVADITCIHIHLWINGFNADAFPEFYHPHDWFDPKKLKAYDVQYGNTISMTKRDIKEVANSNEGHLWLRE